LDQPLRIGILGTANIARSFVSGVSSSKQVTVAAVASRDPEKARQFAQQNAIPRHFGCYEQLLADDAIDAIYNPLPNSLHAEWSIRAVRAGKHVLCEKPLAATAREARAMFDAARQQKVHLVEGFPYLAQPQTIKLRELLAARAIGDPRLIQASFGFTLADPKNIRLNPQLAGGALMDLGVYPVSLIRVVAGQRPARVQASAQWSGGVDRTLAATLEFAGGLVAQVTCSFNSALHRQALIAGSTGVIQTTYLNHTSQERPGDLHLRSGAGANAVDSVIQAPSANGFLEEAESFERLVRNGPGFWTGATPEESIDIMMTVDAILESARTKNAVDIPGGA
jgi:D-xylose 1-dehydrogenase (NADP+, D-xylono-1,5-lactone-forming)